MTKLLVALGAALFAWLTPSFARADVRVYTLAIGNNAPPAQDAATGERLPTLRYADDDAAAFFAFARNLSREAELLAVLDAPSQRRFPDLARVARAPSLDELRRVVSRWKTAFEDDRKAGHDPVLLFFFSGHGARAGAGPASLVLIDAPLTHDILYDEVLAALPARYVHLIVDACYAETVVRPRDAHAQTVELSPEQLQSVTERATLARFPHVGALIATSTTARAFEWDAIERGVFTHELLSGLRGGADVNGDGRIEYSEIDAFLSSANRDVSDPRARLSVIAHPPPIDRRAPIADLSALRHGATLSGAAAALGKLSVEDALGNRVLDLHAEPGFRVKLRVPAGDLFLRAAGGEARVHVRAGESVALDGLPLEPSRFTERGAVEASIERGLFSERFGPGYYRAFVDGHEELSPVPTQAPAREEPPPLPPASHGTRTAGWITLGVAGAFAAAAAVSAGLALSAKSDYDATSFEREASDAKDRFATFRTLSIVGAATTLVAAGVGTWLVLRDGGSKPSNVGLARSARGLELRW